MKKLGLFFTYNVSLEDWYSKGLFYREKLIYEKQIERNIFSEVYWFTYGSNDLNLSKELKSKGELNSNIIIIQKPYFFKGKIGNIIYSFLLPIIQKKYIKKVDLLKTNQMLGSWSAVFSKLLFTKKLIVRTGYTESLFTQGTFKLFIIKNIEKFAFKLSDKILVSSKYDKNYIINNFKIRGNKVNVLRNFIDIELFKNTNIVKNNDLIFVGRLNNQKNIFSLIDAVKTLDYNLDIYGDGELKQEILNYLDKNNIKNIFLKGLIKNSELPKILNSYKIYTLVSFYEGMPKTLLEAMSCGLACIGTDVRGTNEVIKNGHNGVLVNTDSDSINNGLIQLLSNEKFSNKLGNNACDLIKNKYSLDVIAEKEIAIYNDIIKNEILG